MKRGYSFYTDITTEAKFETVLGELLDAATRNNIDVRGSWVCGKPDETQIDLEVRVYELEKKRHRGNDFSQEIET